MHKFNEELLQFVWNNRLLKPVEMYTVSGNPVRIIKPGEWNRDAGPDFFNGQIEISGIVLAGNIELHVKAGDWLRHKHQNDRAYDQIILHVVYENDVEIGQNSEFGVEVLELRHYIDHEVPAKYSDLCSAKTGIPCHSQLASVNDFHFLAWIERLGVERLESKQKKIESLLHQCHGDYSQVMYLLLLSNFGFKVNALPMELLGRHLPVSILLRHADNLLQLEALLFGVAGMLDKQLEDKYLRGLQNEFVFLQKKYGLKSLDSSVFKLSKLRPANFPQLRLAQFAALLHRHPGLFTGQPELRDADTLKQLLKVELNDYWKHHYLCDGNTTKRDLHMGESSAENIIINTVAPFYFFCGTKFMKEEYRVLALNLLNSCKAEDNRKTRYYAAKKPLIKTAGNSQALIHLFDNYCVAKKCLSCGIGMEILKRNYRVVVKEEQH